MPVVGTLAAAMKNTRMRIRRSIEGDAAALLDIWLRSVRASHHFLSEPDIQSLLPVVRDQVLPALDLWILCNGSAPIGFMGVGENSIEALFVAPEYFRRGGGMLMVEFARHRLSRTHAAV